MQKFKGRNTTADRHQIEGEKTADTYRLTGRANQAALLTETMKQRCQKHLLAVLCLRLRLQPNRGLIPLTSRTLLVLSCRVRHVELICELDPKVKKDKHRLNNSQLQYKKLRLLC